MANYTMSGIKQIYPPKRASASVGEQPLTQVRTCFIQLSAANVAQLFL